MEDEMYISDELRELLYERWLSRYEKSVEEEREKRRKLRQELWNLFFIVNICFLHDREYCCECRRYATATCLPDDF